MQLKSTETIGFFGKHQLKANIPPVLSLLKNKSEIKVKNSHNNTTNAVLFQLGCYKNTQF